jgi:hypothetical protein
MITCASYMDVDAVVHVPVTAVAVIRELESYNHERRSVVGPECWSFSDLGLPALESAPLTVGLLTLLLSESHEEINLLFLGVCPPILAP